MAKLWKGRFKGGTNPLMEAYSESISYDRELAEVDIQGSLAHGKMLASVGLMSKKDYAAIRKGLGEVLNIIKSGKAKFDTADEDIHMSVEKMLIARVGEAAKRIHTARSRNDQVATDLRLWTRGKIDLIDSLIANVQRALVNLAAKNDKLVIPGYTHLQRAQPVLVAQHLLAYVEMFGRDRERLTDARKRVNRMPLGSGALAGTTLPIDRHMVMRELGFEALCENSMDGVSDRDFVIEVLAALSTLFIHLSRFSEDIILWSSSEWGLIKLDDAWSTGSSIMPQKRNPDLLELTRGKTGRVVGSLVSILMTVKGLPMTYNRDLQEDKEPIFDAVKQAEGALACIAGFVPTIKFEEKVAASMLVGGFLDATVLAEYLVEKGMPFRVAHGVSGRLVRHCEEKGLRLCEVDMKTMQAESKLIGKDIYKCLDPANTPKAYKSAGSAGHKEVGKAIRKWKARLK
ncbi:MAG: argininosuccinate lyase [Planctomycetes bacterium]|nr:argininosuccinate lyase [Planctomycetota bacterium]